ncbi:hypothetical protein PCE1_000435 [Barthelona sp. PCE]
MIFHTQNIVWTFKTSGSGFDIESGDWELFYYSSPALFGENLYIGTSNDANGRKTGGLKDHYTLFKFHRDSSAPIWSLDFGPLEVRGGPVIHDDSGVLYIYVVLESHTDDKSKRKQDFLYQIRDNGATATVMWNYTISENVDDAGGFQWAELQRIYPSIDESGNVYVLGRTFNSFTKAGIRRWNITVPFESDFPIKGIGFQPTIHNGYVYFGADKFYCYRASDGALMYHLTKIDHTIDRFGQVVPRPDGTLAVGTMKHKVFTFFPNGTEKYRANLGEGKIIVSPAVDATGNMYMGTKNNDKSRFVKLHGETGVVVWSIEDLYDVYSSPILGKKRVYFAGEDRYIYGAEQSTGEITYSTKLVGRTGILGSDVNQVALAMDPSGNIYVGDMDGILYKISTDDEPGSSAFSYTMGKNMQRVGFY